MHIDYEKLQQDLLNTIGCAIHTGYGQAIIDYSNVEGENVDKTLLCFLAKEYGINVDDYLVYD